MSCVAAFRCTALYKHHALIVVSAPVAIPVGWGDKCGPLKWMVSQIHTLRNSVSNQLRSGGNCLVNPELYAFSGVAGDYACCKRLKLCVAAGRWGTKPFRTYVSAVSNRIGDKRSGLSAIWLYVWVYLYSAWYVIVTWPMEAINISVAKISRYGPGTGQDRELTWSGHNLTLNEGNEKTMENLEIWDNWTCWTLYSIGRVWSWSHCGGFEAY